MVKKLETSNVYMLGLFGVLKLVMAMGIYSYTFKSVIFKSVKIKMFSESVKMVPVVISENDTFESVILESVKIESVGVEAQAQCLLYC